MIKTPNLTKMKCQACEGLEDKLSAEQISNYLKFVKNWDLIANHGIAKEFKFKNFKEALAFTNKVGNLAEKEGHHPNILLTWGKVRITSYTHKIDGLSINDFILAAKIDKLS